jgi:FdhE protein
VPTPHPDALWRLASAQWAEITANLPNLAPAVSLQQRLVRLTLDATAAIHDTQPFTASSAAILEKWVRGLPALRNEVIIIPPALKDFLVPLCEALAEGGAGDSVLHIRDAIAAKAIDADSLLSVSLARNGKAIRTSALHMGFSPDLVWLIGELGSAPLAHRLSAGLKASTTRDARDVRSADLPPSRKASADHRSLGEGGQVGPDWNRGYCPFCGSWPAFIEARNHMRELRCSYCALAWSLQSHRCVYCGNSATDFVAAAPDVSQPQRRVELCGRCSGYTKVIDVVEPTPFPLLAIADLATMHLDQGAMNRGYRRPELFDLDSIEARTSTC